MYIQQFMVTANPLLVKAAKMESKLLQYFKKCVVKWTISLRKKRRSHIAKTQEMKRNLEMSTATSSAKKGMMRSVTKKMNSRKVGTKTENQQPLRLR